MHEVSDAISIMGIYLDQIISVDTSSMFVKSQKLKSMGEGEDEEELPWSTECDKDGWYTAVVPYSEEGYYSGTETYKMRYLSETKKIEYSMIDECTYHDGSTSSTSTFTSIFKGENGLWNGEDTLEINNPFLGKHSRKTKFEDLDATNGCGRFTIWVDGSLYAELTITPEGTENVRITGYTYEGSTKKEIDKTLPVGTADGDSGGTTDGDSDDTTGGDSDEGGITTP